MRGLGNQRPDVPERRDVELDLIKNYEGYEVTFVEAPAKTPAQIDDLSDLIQLLQISLEADSGPVGENQLRAQVAAVQALSGI